MGRLSGVCGEVVWRLKEGCVESMEGCVEGMGRLSGGCWEAIWRA